MKNGDLVYHSADRKRFYIALNVKKYYHGFKNRVNVLCPSSGNRVCFLKEELEVLNENR